MTTRRAIQHHIVRVKKLGGSRINKQETQSNVFIPNLTKR